MLYVAGFITTKTIDTLFGEALYVVKRKTALNALEWQKKFINLIFNEMIYPSECCFCGTGPVVVGRQCYKQVQCLIFILLGYDKPLSGAGSRPIYLTDLLKQVIILAAIKIISYSIVTDLLNIIIKSKLHSP